MLGVAHHVLSLAHSRGIVAGVHSHIAMRCPARQDSRFACKLEVPGFIGGIILSALPQCLIRPPPRHLIPNQQHFPFRHWKLEHLCRQRRNHWGGLLCLQQRCAVSPYGRSAISPQYHSGLRFCGGMPSSRGEPPKTLQCLSRATMPMCLSMALLASLADSHAVM